MVGGTPAELDHLGMAQMGIGDDPDFHVALMDLYRLVLEGLP